VGDQTRADRYTYLATDWLVSVADLGGGGSVRRLALPPCGTGRQLHDPPPGFDSLRAQRRLLIGKIVYAVDSHARLHVWQTPVTTTTLAMPSPKKAVWTKRLFITKRRWKSNPTLRKPARTLASPCSKRVRWTKQSRISKSRWKSNPTSRKPTITLAMPSSERAVWTKQSRISKSRWKSIRLRKSPQQPWQCPPPKGQCGRSNHHYQMAFATRPDYAEAHVNLGNILCQRGRSDEAITQLAKGAANQARLPGCPEQSGLAAGDLSGRTHPGWCSSR